MEAYYEKIATNIRAFLPRLEKQLVAAGYSFRDGSVTVTKRVHPRSPFSNRRALILRAELAPMSGANPVYLDADLYRTSTTTEQIPNQMITLIPTLAVRSRFSPEMQTNRATVLPIVREWWHRVWRSCYDRSIEKKREVAVYKEEMMAAAWHPRRVERLLAAGVEWEDM